MLNKLAVFIILLISFDTSHAQWTWLNPKPSGYTCSKIIFTDSLTGYLFNSNGDLVRTTDQGANWNYQQNFLNATTLDIKDSTGVISGNSGMLYISKDNGTSWLSQRTELADDIIAADIVSRDTIILASSNGKIFRSDDRGNTWQTYNSGISISSVDFINSKVGFIGGMSTYILKTEDGGETWQKTVTNAFSPHWMVIKFLDINNGFAMTEHSTLLSTKDGGQTWAKHDFGDKIYSLFFLTSTTGFACGADGVTYRTDDGGTTWKWISLTGRTGGYDLYSTCFLYSNVGFTVGERGRILKTIDGGTSWTMYSIAYNDIHAISVPTTNMAYATVSNTIIKTVNGGNSWKQLAFSFNDNGFNLCHFSSADTGFVTTSDNPHIYKTCDGGVNWKQINLISNSISAMTCMQFINDRTGFVSFASSNCQIAKTTDGGETWVTICSAMFQGRRFSNIHFLDEKTGYASWDDRLFKTEDSAKTWKELWQDENKDISGICFVNSQTGFVAGENALLKRTNDNGKTWTNIQITNLYYDDIYDIKFFDEKTGYLTAENGAIFKTIDSGYTWQKLGPVSYHKMVSIGFSPDSSIYLAGQNGAVIRSGISDVKTSACIQNEWTGTAGTAWENPANWSCRQIPGPYTNVIIGGASVVTINSYVVIKTLKINPQASLSIGSSFGLKLSSTGY